MRPDGRPAVTEYRILKENQEWTVLKIHLLTGRTHQIRVHFAHEGHPLVGDPLYGTKDGRIARQALHAWTVRFRHPRTGEEMLLTAPMPGIWRGCWGRKAVQSEEQEGKRQTTNPQDCLKGRSDLSPKI